MTNVYHHYRKSLLLIVFFCVQFVFNSFAGAAGNVTTNRDSTIVDSLPPLINSFTPLVGRNGTAVLIFGKNLTGTVKVSFGGTLASNFIVLSDTAIKAVVGKGSTGSVMVATPFGTASKPGFIFIQDSTLAPVITSFNPTSARRGSKVLIKGIHFTGTNAVRFGGVLADTVTLVNDTLVIAVVGAGASGSVSVTTPFGTDVKPGFVFIGDSLFVTARSSVSSTVSTALSLYPNPASKYAIVINPITHHPSHLQVVDLMGRIVRTINVGSEATKTTVDVSGLTAGIYKLVWNDDKKVITHTLLVK